MDRTEEAVALGLAAGIIFDATVICALLVPAIMRLMGRWNWWLPERVGRVLLVRGSRAAGEVAARELALGAGRAGP